MPDALDNRLLSEHLVLLLDRLADTKADEEAAREAIWAEADAALVAAGAEEDADLALPIWDRDLAAVRGLIEAWRTGKRPLPEWDKALCKRAFKAYKKRLKLMKLDDESTAGVNPLSAGRESTILGIRPPEQYPPEVWAVLVRQGKLADAGDGLLELGTG